MRKALVLVALIACSSSHPSNGDKPIGPDTSSAVDAGAPVTPPTTTSTAPGTEPYASGTRIKARYLVGDDGSRQFVGWLDSTTQTPCAFYTAADGQTRCLPTSYITSAGIFSDPNCAVALASIAKGCAAPSYVLSIASTGPVCPTTVTSIPSKILTRGALYAESALYQMADTCMAATESVVDSLHASNDYYAIGAEIPASTFAAATEQHD